MRLLTASFVLQHNPDSKRGDSLHPCSARGILNVLALVVIVTGLLALFAGYPIIAHYTKHPDNTSGFNIGGTNGSGQVPNVPSILGLVDNDTLPADREWTNADGIKHHCVFSDEFNTPGRTFWPGDDPYWTAVDIWYGATGDYEWYAPEQINTTDGHLQITMEDRPTHNLNFRSGMLQSWNKFCFQGGYIEFSAILPGSPNTQGWWPGLWTMGNLGRPGYLGTTDVRSVTWPYSYQGCDNGIRPNQSDIANGTPDSVVTSVKYGKTGLNWLPGMRLPSCTCSGEDHPGPNNNVGRSSPEIDALEAQTAEGVGEASQSLQTAPFDLAYDWDQDVAVLHPGGGTKINSYTGGVYQEAVSGLSPIPNKAYELATNPTFTTFGFEYVPDYDNDGSGYISWYIDGKQTWTVTGASTPPRPNIGIGRRPIPTEPLSIILNLGISEGFQHIEFDTLQFPATMKVDYVRVYQRDGQADKTTCDPADHPTADYINRHGDVYNNPNVTQWRDKYNWPKNRLIDGC
ncbi:concanavalin A-like lectin/glucanase [Ceraceosorus guamensis]|uniref:Concanavalin A-like lectin/glucanase n=1 Tax=Ceraceosorus guamensis TaxID=1522189 RepID=A0A316W3W9_9BASI|nr:concanavalin A-like lectin/glucanase [Ceraceosorus guamensis]PWN44596.1 concanavalin A-like lectin/glucanase [Ceraceosorus guamensis]